MTNLRKTIEDEFSKISSKNQETLDSLKPLFINYLKQTDYREKENFATAIKIAISYYISERELSHFHRITIPTIHRWADGISAPYYASRPYVLKWIVEQLE